MPHTRAVPTFLLAALLGVVLANPVAAQWNSNGNAVCVYAGEQSYPAAAADGTGGAFVVWVDYRSGASSLYAQRITSTGTIASGWPAGGVPLCVAAGDQRSPLVLPDGAGGVFVAWEDDRAGAADPNLYLQRLTVTGALATGWTADGLAVCAAAGTQRGVALAVEGGSAIVAWEDDRNGASNDVYAQRVSAAGAILWAPDGTPVCATPGNQTLPSVVGDRSGGAVLAWQDTRNGLADIYAQRLDASGAALWLSGGIALCGAANDQISPHLVADGVGGAIATWDDYRAGNSDVYAQRLNASGTVLWTAGGVVLCSNIAEQYCSPPVGDGAGGAIVPWNDFRSGPGNLYAQRVTASGAIATGWTPNGVAICTAGDVSDPVAAPDGLGGAFFVWDDARAGPSALDLYGVRLTSSGSVGSGWTAGGTLLCNAANNQLRPTLSADGNGSAIVSWYDDRNLNFDIYAKRMAAGGVTLDAPLAELEGLALTAAPNPMRTTATLRFRLAATATVRLDVLDLAGRVVRVLLGPAGLAAGPHEIAWDGRDTAGAPAPAGLYFVRLLGPAPEVQRLTLLR